MRKVAFLLIFLSISLIGEKESPMAKEIKKIEFPEIEWKLPEVGVDIKRLELPSGAILFLKENRNIPLIEINVFIKGGSSYLGNGKRAISELFSRMIQRGGTKNFGPDEFTEKLEINAIYFDVSENNYYYSVNLLTQRNVIDTALVLLEEALFHPTFDNEVMKIEKKRIIEDWKKRMDEPNLLIEEISRYIMFKGHPSGSLPDVRLLETADKKVLKELKNRFVQPANMIIGIVGDFESEDMEQKIKRIFDEKYNTDEIIGEIPALTPEAPKKVYFYNIKRPQALFHIQHRGKTAPFPEMYNVMIMDFILGRGGFASRIMKKVRVEKGLAYRVSSYYSMFSPLSGEFYVYCGTRQDAVHKASEYILEEIKHIREEEVSSEELKVAKEAFINSAVTRLGNDWNYIPMILTLELTGIPLDYYETLNDSIEKVEIDKVLLAAQNYLHPERLSMVIIGDREKIDTMALKEQFGEIEFIDYRIPEI